MKIRSKSDVITNSSSEVFCFKIDSLEYKELKELIPEIEFTEFKTWDDIRNYVTSKEYWEWDLTKYAQCTHGKGAVEPKFDFYGGYQYMDFRDDLRFAGKTDDEIWEFFKFGYENVLGLAYYTIYEGEKQPQWKDKYWDWVIEKDRKETKEFLESNFKKGDILAIPIGDSNIKIFYKLPVLVTYNKELENPYTEEAIPEAQFSTSIMVALDIKKARLATPEEVIKYKKAYEDKKCN